MGQPPFEFEGECAVLPFWRYSAVMKKCEGVPATVEAFRSGFRRTIGDGYRGRAHFAFTTFASISVIAFALSQVRSATWREWLVLPIGFLVANLAEYLGHKGPMHHPVKRLRIIHTRHTVQHHHFFTHDAMECESPRDFKIMLFPPALLIFFFVGIAAPVAAAFFLVISANAGWIFLATGVGYYLTYEWLHFAYHLPAESTVGRLGLVRVLRQHHATHHDLTKMGRWNFNITFPIFDAVFGTTWKDQR